MATPNKAWPKRLAPCSWLVNIHIAPPSTKASAAMVLAVGPVRLSTTTCRGWFQGRCAPAAPAPGAAAGDHHDQVDGVADQVRRRPGPGALRQPVEAVESRQRIVGVQRRDPARMPGLPRVAEAGGR